MDLGYSFYQHFHMPLGGDMAQIVMPSPTNGYYQVLHDPFGLNALLKHEVYSNPNRFFAHWSTSVFLLNMPLFAQNFLSPINSVYFSCALGKILTQILIIYLLAVYISNSRNILRFDFIVSAIIITPLFQTAGFNRYMGIIDQSVIYTFFYALPLGLLLLFFLPFFRAIYYDKILNNNIVFRILLALFIIILSLNGPLVPGVVLIVCPMVLLNLWWKNFKQLGITPIYKRALLSIRKIPNYLLYYFLGISIFSLYSLYIGQYNTLNFDGSISLAERYSRLPSGIYYLITTKLGFPLLLFMIGINLLIIVKHYKSEEGAKIMKLLKWISIFAGIYILLLPLGGYRGYRPNIIRYDTIMPITISLIFIYGMTTFYLIKNISKKYKSTYVIGIILLSLIYTISDNLDTRDFDCEKQALETMAQSSDKIVLLDGNCPIMEFRIVNDFEHSELKAGLFYHWNVTNEKKLFYQKEDDDK